MKIDAGLFSKIVIKMTKIVELLGYKAEHICVEHWSSNDKGELEFWLVDSESEEEFRIVLPKPKE